MTTVGPYKITPITLKIRSRHDDGAGTDLKLIKGDIYRETELNGTMSLSFSTVNPILCRLHETDEYTHENPGYSLIENENEILLEGHVYKIKQITDRGNYKRLTCVHEFSELSKVQRYEYLEGGISYQRVLDYLLNGSGWTYEFNDEFIGELTLFLQPEKFGVGSVLKLIKEFVRRTGMEFEILPNKKLFVSTKIGGSDLFDFEYGTNIKGVSTESDSTDLYTRIRGFYANVVGQDENGDDIIEGWNHVDVINEAFEEEYGALEMESLWESNIKSAGEMEFACWLKLYSAVKYNIDLTATEFDVQIGQYVNVSHPTVDTSNFASNARIFNIKEGLINNELKPIEVTIANYSFSFYEEITNDRLDNVERELRSLKNRTTNFMLSKFMIGTKNVLAIPGSLLGEKATIPQDITATLEYKDSEEFKGLFITKKTAYSNFHVQVTTYNKANVATGTYDGSAADLETWLLPNDNVAAICVEVLQVPPEEFDEQSHKKQILAVKFDKTGGDDDDDVSDYLSEFRIGDVDMLSEASDETAQVVSYIKGSVTEVIASTTYTTPEVLTGAFAQLKEAYADYHLTALDYRKTGEQSAFQVFNYSNVLASWNYPNSETGIRSIVLVVTEEPFATLNASNIDDSVMAAYGVKVEMNEDETAGVIKPKMYMEYGSAPLANTMNLSFEKGPYDAVYSITTGVSGSGEIEPVTIVVNMPSGGSGFTAYAADASGGGMVNFHAVCMKMEKVEKK